MTPDAEDAALEEPVVWVAAGNYSSLGIIPSELYRRDLAKLSEELGHHVYLICTRPRTIVCKARFSSRPPAKITVTLRREATASIKRAYGRLTVPARGAHHRSVMVDRSGCLCLNSDEGAFRVNAAQLIAAQIRELRRRSTPESRGEASTLVRQFASLDVVYVGKSFGSDGSRHAVDRLSSGHQQLDKALARINDYEPQLEAFIILIDCHAQDSNVVVAITPENAGQLAELTLALQTNPNFGFEGRARVVDAVEGGLIRLLQPPLNRALRGFPMKEATSLRRRMSEAGVGVLGIRLDLWQAGVRLRFPDGHFREHVEVYYDLASGEMVTVPGPLSTRSPYLES